MSWDQILGMVAGGGNKQVQTGTGTTPGQPPASGGPNMDMSGPPASAPEAPGFGQKAGEFLMGGSGGPGMLEQAGRLIGTIAAFSQSPQSGMQLINFFQKQDMMSADAISRAAAEGLSYEEANARYPGMIPRFADTKQVPEEMPTGVQGPPGMKEVLSFPSSPEDMEAARIAEFKAQRAAPGYGQGFSEEDMANVAAQSQRTGQPTDFRMNNAAMSASMPEGGFDQGLYTVGHRITPEGMTTSAQTMDITDRAIPLEQAQALPVPDGVAKTFYPLNDGTGRVAVKFSSKYTGNSLSAYELKERYAKQLYPGDIEKQATFMFSDSETTSKADLGDYVTRLEAVAKRKLTPGELSEAQAMWTEKEGDIGKLQAAKDPSKGKAARMRAFEERILGGGAQGTAVEGATASTEVLEKERNSLYDNTFGGKDITSTIPTPSPSVSPSPRVTPNMETPQVMDSRKGRRKIKATFDDSLRGRETVSMAVAQEIMTGDVQGAAETLAQFMNMADMTPEQKKMYMRSVVDNIPLSPQEKLQLEKLAIEELE